MVRSHGFTLASLTDGTDRFASILIKLWLDRLCVFVRSRIDIRHMMDFSKYQCHRVIKNGPAELPTGSNLLSDPPTKPQASCGRAPGVTRLQLLTRTWFCQEDSLGPITAREGSWTVIPPPCLNWPWIFALKYVDLIWKIPDPWHSIIFWQSWHSITHWPYKVVSFTDLATIKN